MTQATRLVPVEKPFKQHMTVPGSKSYTIRALLLAALSSQNTGKAVTIENPLISDDTEAAIVCLRSLGLTVTVCNLNDTRNAVEGSSGWREPKTITVSGALNLIPDQDYLLNTNLSAATLRFFLALSAVIPGTQTLLGHAGLNRRPVRDLVDSLRQLGATVDYLDKEGYPPVKVSSKTLHADTIHIAGSTSSQYVSALLMIAPLIHPSDTTGSTARPLHITLPEPPVSKPYLDMTTDIMSAFGVNQVEVNNNCQSYRIPRPQQYHARHYIIEPDASSMAYPLAIAVLTKSTITISDVNQHSKQADMKFIGFLESLMGCKVTYTTQASGLMQLTLEGRGVRPVHADMTDCPDQAQTLAVLAAFAPGESRLDGLQSLRVKETDRLAALESELEKMGVATRVEGDSLFIQGGNPKPASISTFGDHRMAMAFAVAGSLLEGLSIEDPDVVNKTYPTFWHEMRQLGLNSVNMTSANTTKRPVHLPKIVLIGFMGAGKSAVAKQLALQLSLPTIEMDDCILEQSGYSSIAEVFSEKGEAHFRELEMSVAKSLRMSSNVIISTGGGVIMNTLTMAYLAENKAQLIYLDTPWSQIKKRLAHETVRPLFQTLDKAQELYELRLALYKHYQSATLSTTGILPEEIARQISQHILSGTPLQETVSALCTV